ncbi:hypothetical protein TIFTF001_001335 [Ficus carica]|uniref:Uncharacterized protein n=1 Tax=Ficus carica TaxID=3494 RepID=A0AA87YZF5_FICCA|nr:hypothetical protein TIFTF001_001335 [Ficus carica]
MGQIPQLAAFQAGIQLGISHIPWRGQNSWLMATPEGDIFLPKWILESDALNMVCAGYSLSGSSNRGI